MNPATPVFAENAKAQPSCVFAPFGSSLSEDATSPFSPLLDTMCRSLFIFLLATFCVGRLFSQAPAPEVLDDECKRRINYFQPSDAQIKALLVGGPDARKAMEDMLQSIDLQAVTIAKLLVDDVAAKYEARISAQYRQIAALEARLAALERSIAQAGPASVVEPVSQPNVVESRIVSDFRGLDNGQIWRQTEQYIWIWIAVRPHVLICRSEMGAFKMKVDGIEHQVTVERLK